MDNPQAFPSKGYELVRDEVDGNWNRLDIEMLGMTLRDYFAGQVLTGLSISIGKHFVCESIDWNVTSKACYQLADAMLKERGNYDN